MEETKIDPGSAELLDTGGEVDRGAEDVAVLEQFDLSGVHPDPQGESDGSEPVAQGDCEQECLTWSVEAGEEAVAQRLHDVAVMFGRQPHR